MIAQISDLHIKPPGSLAYGRVDTAGALERCVAALNAFGPEPDLVVISGDLADTPTLEEYEHLKRLLARLELPFVGIPGNHDSRELMRAAFPDADYAFASGPLNQRVETGGLDLVLLEFERRRQAAWRTRRGHPAMAGRHACVLAGPARAAVPAPPAVRDRHLAHGPTEPAQRRRIGHDREAPSTRAADRHWSRASRNA